VGLAAISGGVLAVAFPGTGDQGWLAFIALVPLLVAIEGTTWRWAGTMGDESLFLEGHPRVKRLAASVLMMSRQHLPQATELWVLRYE